MPPLLPHHHLSFLLLLLYFTAAASDDPTAFVYAGCSQLKYSLGSPYQFNVDSLLSSLANAATFSPYSNFTSSAASSSSPVYGLFQCRGDLDLSTCSSCVRAALSRLGTLCTSSSAAALQLQGCSLRYGNESSIGKPDTTLLYKKCGNGGFGPDMPGMRDAALASLATGQSGGDYRVGAAGYVQAIAQCDGDLGGKSCGDCVAAACDQLKGVCSSAGSGDVYLGKCYARYWSSAIGAQHSNSNNDDGAGKTLALIIGLMAGVALIILFASCIRRAGNGKS